MVISFRYNVIGTMQAGEQERVYSAVAVRIFQGQVSVLAQIIEGLRAVYPNDEQFKAAFSDKELKTTQSRNNRIVRYLLCELEHQMSGIRPNRDDSAFTVEHILPQNPGDGWGHMSEMEIDANLYRLGNMTLLEPGLNGGAGNEDYEVKCTAYLPSKFKVTQEIPKKWPEWAPKQIGDRQKSMARLATAIWRVAQIS